MPIPIGQKTATDVLHISINMPYRDPAGMKAFVDSVSNPKSPSYRQFITPAQIGTRFSQPSGKHRQSNRISRIAGALTVTPGWPAITTVSAC